MPADISAALQPSLAVLAIALVLDVVAGEPPTPLHPVAWMGRSASLLMRLAPRQGALGQLFFGALVAIAIPAGFTLASMALLAGAARWPVIELLVASLLLTSMFAVRALGAAALRVQGALTAGHLDQARHQVQSLCSRDPSALDPPHIISATVESLAENASDSVVAPLLYYALLGLPGIVFYRAVNTLDAMIGYHGRYEYLGKASARLDDLLNLVPARLSAGLVLAAGWLSGLNVRRGWRMLRRDGRTTESPNAGLPMAAMAGLLGVELHKRDHYRLGDPLAPLETATIGTAWRVVASAAILAALLVTIILGARHVFVA